MLESLIDKATTAILSGSGGAVTAVLLLVIGFCFYVIHYLSSELRRKDEKLEKIIDDYYKGNLSLTETLTNLKFALLEIKKRSF